MPLHRLAGNYILDRVAVARTQLWLIKWGPLAEIAIALHMFVIGAHCYA